MNVLTNMCKCIFTNVRKVWDYNVKFVTTKISKSCIQHIFYEFAGENFKILWT